MIEEYHFGSMQIDGKTFTDDLEIDLDGKVKKWRRVSGHFIDTSDVENVLNQNPETIVIGTGESGVAKVNPQTQKEIRAKGIELIIEPTPEAIQSFNSLKQTRKVVGFFHLTC